MYIHIYIGNVLSAPLFPPEWDEDERRRDVNATKEWKNPNTYVER